MIFSVVPTYVFVKLAVAYLAETTTTQLVVFRAQQHVICKIVLGTHRLAAHFADKAVGVPVAFRHADYGRSQLPHIKVAFATVLRKEKSYEEHAKNEEKNVVSSTLIQTCSVRAAFHPALD